MFRLKLTLIYLSVTIIGVIVTLQLLSGAKTSGDKKLVKEIARSHLVYEQVKKLRDLQLRDVAQAVAQSEVNSYLGVLRKHRKTLHRIQQELHDRFPPKEQKSAWRGALQNEYDDVHKRIGVDLAERMAAAGTKSFADDKAKAAFVAQTVARLVDCQSQSVRQCAYEFAHGPLVSVAKRLRKKAVYGVKPSVLIVADDRFVGLADADREFYTQDSHFAEHFPVAREVKKGIILRDIAKVHTRSHKGTFFIAAAPMFDEERNFVGVVLVGAEVDSGLTEAEKKVLGRDITYFDGKQPIRTTLEPRGSALEALIIESPPVGSDETRLHTLQTEATVAQFIPLTGNWSAKSIRVAVSASRDSAESLDAVTIFIPLVFGLLFVVGLALFMWALHIFLRPAFEIDTGVHEVIGGDRDYVFPHDYNTELWSAMAQSLNLMVGELVGREMVDEEGFDEWAHAYLEHAHEGEDQEYEDEHEEHEEESAHDYYHRIYRRFSELQVASGEEAMPYPQFVDKVSRTEAALTKRLGLEGVKLEVTEGASGPVLKPHKRREDGESGSESEGDDPSPR